MSFKKAIGGFSICNNILHFFEGDGNPISKKDPELRRNELLEVSAKPVLEFLLENISTLIKEGGTRYLN